MKKKPVLYTNLPQEGCKLYKLSIIQIKQFEVPEKLFSIGKNYFRENNSVTKQNLQNWQLALLYLWIHGLIIPQLNIIMHPLWKTTVHICVISKSQSFKNNCKFYLFKWNILALSLKYPLNNPLFSQNPPYPTLVKFKPKHLTRKF